MFLFHTVSVNYFVHVGGVVKDQAEADEDTSWKERAAMAVGKRDWYLC